MNGNCYIFSEGYSLYFFSFLTIYGGFGVGVLKLGSWIGFLGKGISVDGVWVGACGVEPYGFCGVGAL